MTSLTAHDSLQELLLGKTGIGVEDCEAMSELLSSFTSLKWCSIRSTSHPLQVVG